MNQRVNLSGHARGIHKRLLIHHFRPLVCQLVPWSSHCRKSLSCQLSNYVKLTIKIGVDDHFWSHPRSRPKSTKSKTFQIYTPFLSLQEDRATYYASAGAIQEFHDQAPCRFFVNFGLAAPLSKDCIKSEVMKAPVLRHSKNLRTKRGWWGMLQAENEDVLDFDNFEITTSSTNISQHLNFAQKLMPSLLELREWSNVRR